MILVVFSWHHLAMGKRINIDSSVASCRYALLLRIASRSGRTPPIGVASWFSHSPPIGAFWLVTFFLGFLGLRGASCGTFKDSFFVWRCFFNSSDRLLTCRSILGTLHPTLALDPLLLFSSLFYTVFSFNHLSFFVFSFVHLSKRIMGSSSSQGCASALLRRWVRCLSTFAYCGGISFLSGFFWTCRQMAGSSNRHLLRRID